MWQPPWGCYSIPGCPPNSNLGDFLGQPQGALHGGGYNPHVQPMGHNHPQGVPTRQWTPSGQALWQAASSTMPLGNFTGSHTPMVPASIAPQGPPPMPFPPGAPMQPTNLPVHPPPMLHQSVGSPHPGSCPGPHGMVTHQSHTSPGLCHQPCEPLPIHSSAPPIPAGGIDFKALENRLDAAFT